MDYSTLQKYACHGCVFLGQALFRDFLKYGKSSKKSSPSKQILSKDQFIVGSQKIVQLIGDDQLLNYYVKVCHLLLLPAIFQQSYNEHIIVFFPIDICK